jgi:hypothetical protein
MLSGLLLAGGIYVCGYPLTASGRDLATLIPGRSPAAASQPGLPEPHLLTLDWPPVIRVGDADTVRLTLAVDANGGPTPTAIAPNSNAAYSVLAEARLDMPGMQVTPAGTASQPLPPGGSVTLAWRVQPTGAGRFRGVVWFYLRFIPLDGSPAHARAISAQSIEIEAVTFMGLEAGAARLLGVAGMFLGLVLALPFIEDGLRWLWKRLKRRVM